MERIRESNRILILIALTSFFCIVIFVILFIRSSAAERQAEPPLTTTIEVNGKALEVPYVMKINGEKVSLDEYRFYFMTQKALMSSGSTSYFAKGDREEKVKALKENTLQALLRDRAICKLADINNLALSSSEKEQIENDVDNQIRTLGSRTQYIQALAQVYMTDSIYQDQWEVTFCYEKLYQYYFGENGTALTKAAITSSAVDSETLSESQRNAEYEKQLEGYLEDVMSQMKISYSSEYELINPDTLK